MNQKLKSKKVNTNKGITLIALIITIIVLLILAVVAIRAIQGDGILAHAKNARDNWTDVTAEEEATLQGYEDYIVGLLGETQNGGNPEGDEKPKIIDASGNDARNKLLSEINNTEVWDEYGNKIIVPAGFKITNDASHVTEGIVIEDCTETVTKGSQFVWIPVGEIKKDVAGTTDTITLGRYTFGIVITDAGIDVMQSTGEPEIVQPKLRRGYSYSDSVELHDEWYGAYNSTYSEEPNTAFTNSANDNGGYYIGRYEARTNSTTERTEETKDTLTAVTCKRENAVYNYVTQPYALSKSQEMYTEKPFKSDLINSYAWDTTLVFIQKFGGNSKYSTQRSKNSTYSVTGTTEDVECNVYDMASNCNEWTTEKSSSGFPCTVRGGTFEPGEDNYACVRFDYAVSHSFGYISFRPILYL